MAIRDVMRAFKKLRVSHLGLIFQSEDAWRQAGIAILRCMHLKNYTRTLEDEP